MPFQPIDFSKIEPQGNPFFKDLVDNLSTGYKAGQLPAQLARQKEKEQLANALQQYLVEEQPEKFKSEQLSREAERAFQRASTNKINTMTPFEAQKAALENAWYPKLSQSLVDERSALTKQRDLGITGLGTGGKEQFLFQRLTGQSNPTFTPDQAFEAANAVMEGKTTLPDGTNININPLMLSSLDRRTKAGSTADVISNVIRGMQAEKEMSVLTKYVGDALAPYGDTIAGHSPAQIAATFSNKKDDQIKLGRLAAAQQLQTDLATNQNIINSGRPTASITREILGDMETKIKTNWPFMSNVARQETLRYTLEALDKTLEAKRSIRIGASTASIPPDTSTTSKPTETSTSGEMHFNRKTGRLE